MTETAPGKISPFTQYTPCVMCSGKGYTITQGIKRPCFYCRGDGKLPVTAPNGRWQKKRRYGKVR